MKQYIEYENSKKYSKQFILLSALICLCVFGISMVSGGKLSAYTPLATNTFPNPAAAEPYDLYMTVGSGEFSAPVSAAAILVDAPGTYNILIEDAHFCNVASEYTYLTLDLPRQTEFANPYFSTIFRVVSSSNISLDRMVPINTGWNRVCGAGKNISSTFTVTNADFDAESGKYRVVFAGIYGALNPAYGATVPSAAENSFRVTVTGANNPLIYFTGRDAGFGSTFFNVSNRNRPLSSVVNYTVDIALPCAATSSVFADLDFFDADYGQYQSTSTYPDLTYRVERTLRPGRYDPSDPPPPWVTLINPTVITGRNGETSPILNGFQISPDYVYRLVFSGLSRLNAITYDLKIDNVSEYFASNVCAVPEPTYRCTVTINPPGPFGVGERFDVEVNIDTSGSDTDSSQMTQSTHPITLSSTTGSVQGLGAATPAYTANPPLQTTVTFNNIYSDTAAEHTISASIKGVSCGGDLAVVGTKAYMKIFGGDTMAGGGFGASCTPSYGGVYAWARTDGSGYAGASSQLTVSSLLEVNQLYSASNRGGGNTRAPRGLTFANDSGTTWGGNYGAAKCITDYYTATRDATLNRSNWNGQNFNPYTGAGRIQYTNITSGASSGVIGASGDLSVPADTQVAVYYTGDVRIRSNIRFDTGFSTWASAPNFVLVVLGDIYIDESVVRLDGQYISQGGTIYTCSNASGGGTTYNSSQVYNNCQNQLSVNGSLVGNNIRWLRLRGSLNDANFQEVPDFDTGAGTPAGEIINYTPHMWLAPSPLKIPGAADGNAPTNTIDKYQAIKEMPPIY
ncbi:MAG: hypothetical protein M3Q36_03365 [bacterium]|nr:hypothetical protein [bacterium]